MMNRTEFYLSKMKLGMVLALYVFTLCLTIPHTVYAAPEDTTETTQAMDDIDVGGRMGELAKIDPLDYAKPFSGFNKKTDDGLKNIMKSIYKLLSALITPGLLFSFMFIGLKLAAGSRSGSKEDLMNILFSKIGVFAMFCMITLFGKALWAIIKPFIT